MYVRRPLSPRRTRGLDFFVGFGDINSTFLPKALSPVPTPSPGRPIPDAHAAVPIMPTQLPTSPSTEAALKAEAEATAAL